MKNDMPPIKFKPTPHQQEALRTDISLLVEAGAGSGKTTVLVNRYLKILTESIDLDPSQIVAITYTKKAAGEMKQRILTALNDQQNLTQTRKQQLIQNMYLCKIQTIHAYCTTLLKKYPLEAGCDPQFTILEEAASFSIQKNAIEDTITALIKKQNAPLLALMLEFSLKKIKHFLSELLYQRENIHHWQQNPDSADIFNQTDLVVFKEELSLKTHILALYKNCLTRFQQSKQAAGKLDYSDILLMTEALLTDHPEIRQEIQKNTQYFLIDECQDTDPIQHNIITLLITDPQTQEKKNLFIVGDSQQSIYSFRGAAPEIMSKIKFDFTDTHTAKTISLNENFRSQPIILDFINGLYHALSSKENAPFMALQSNRTETTGSVQFGLVQDAAPADEARVCADWIMNHHHLGTPYGDIAILFRNKRHMALFKAALLAKKIPVYLHANQSIYEREEILDLFCLLKGLLNPHDNLLWFRVLTSPLFGISEQALYCLIRETKSHQLISQLNPHAMAQFLAAHPYITATDQARLSEAAKHIPLWRALSTVTTPHTLINKILDETNAWASYRNQEDGAETIIAISNFLHEIETWPQRTPDAMMILEQMILERKFPTEAIESKIDPKSVNLLTIHAAKGLEFPTVIVAQCGASFNLGYRESIAISKKSGPSLSYKTESDKKQDSLHTRVKNQLAQDTLTEERRIFYVACTRAKDHLLLLATRKSEYIAPETPKNFSDFYMPYASTSPETKTIAFSFQKNTAYPLISSE